MEGNRVSDCKDGHQWVQDVLVLTRRPDGRDGYTADYVCKQCKCWRAGYYGAGAPDPDAPVRLPIK